VTGRSAATCQSSLRHRTSAPGKAVRTVALGGFRSGVDYPIIELVRAEDPCPFEKPSQRV